MTEKYLPEGSLINTPENISIINNPTLFSDAARSHRILEARTTICDNEHNLIVDLPHFKGFIPREEGAVGIADGTTKDIALISRVNKPVCFRVMEIRRDGVAVLSRRAVQEECRENYINTLSSGDVIPATVTHLEPFGCFVDIGCGIPSLIPIDAISVSRIFHPSDRFSVGQNIYAAVKGNDNGRILLTHKELLGTWEENASDFSHGQTVAGTVRSVEKYGIFIELAPNLAGLAEYRDGVREGQRAGVYIKAIIPDKMKIKLIIVDVFDAEEETTKLNYKITEGKLERWVYSTEGSKKKIETIF